MSGGLHPYWEGFDQPAPKRWSPWRTAGVVLAVVVGLFGLAVVMMFILFIVAMNSFGSNK